MENTNATYQKNVSDFKRLCAKYLEVKNINILRRYGRYLSLKAPTKSKKAELIQEIMGVLCGEIVQYRTKRGAPVKNDYVDPTMIKEIERLKKQYLFANVPETPAPREKVDRISTLTDEQRDLLNDFLNSL